MSKFFEVHVVFDCTKTAVLYAAAEDIITAEENIYDLVKSSPERFFEIARVNENFREDWDFRFFEANEIPKGSEPISESVFHYPTGIAREIRLEGGMMGDVLDLLSYIKTKPVTESIIVLNNTFPDLPLWAVVKILFEEFNRIPGGILIKPDV